MAKKQPAEFHRNMKNDAENKRCAAFAVGRTADRVFNK
jgi:hypothetical protein